MNVEDAGTVTWTSSFGASGSNGNDKNEWKDVSFSQTGEHTITRKVVGNSKSYTVVMKAKVEKDVKKSLFFNRLKEKFFAGNYFDITKKAIKEKIIPNRAPGIFRGIGTTKVSETLPGKFGAGDFDGIIHNGKSDAARHAALTFLLSYYFGEYYAAGLSVYHEVSGSGIMTETVMDLLNNRVGINSFTKNKNSIDSVAAIFEIIKKLVKDGELVYLDESYGKSDSTEKALLQPTDK